jgi:hypothetical protein
MGALSDKSDIINSVYLADNEATAKAQLDEKGGYVTSRKVTFMDSVQVYKGNKLTKKDKDIVVD